MTFNAKFWIYYLAKLTRGFGLYQRRATTALYNERQHYFVTDAEFDEQGHCLTTRSQYDGQRHY